MDSFWEDISRDISRIKYQLLADIFRIEGIPLDKCLLIREKIDVAFSECKTSISDRRDDGIFKRNA